MNNELQQRIDKIHSICGAWGLYEPGNSSAIKQALKATSEIGALADAVLKNDIDEIKDAIGDIFVCWVNFLRLEEDLEFDDSLWADSYTTEQLVLMLCGQYADLGGLSMIASRNNLTLLECIDSAIEVISKRKGRIINQVFVKD